MRVSSLGSCGACVPENKAIGYLPQAELQISAQFVVFWVF